MTKPITDAETLAGALEGKPHGRGWRCLCPAHDDHEPSLDIEDGDKGVVFICRTGCTQDAVIDALAARGLWPAEPPKTKTKSRANSGTKAWTLVSEHIYRAEAGQPYLRVRKMLDQHGNRQYPQSHWNGSSWISGAPKGSKIPYRLPQLIAAPLDATIYFCEGEKDADALAKLGLVATTASGGSSAKWDDALTPHFKDRPVVVLPDADEPGRKHGQKVARALNGVAASVEVLDLFPDRSDGFDVSDWLVTDPEGTKLTQLAKDAPLWTPTDSGDSGDDDGLIAELAALSQLQYERRRDDAARQLGTRVQTLDKLIATARKPPECRETAENGQAELYDWWSVAPWPDPVEGNTLVEELIRAIRRYVFLSDDQAVAVALWVMFTWCHDVMAHSPILFVSSAEKDSGKSTLLGVLSFLVRRGMPSVEVSAAALFRSIEKWHPCLLVDEADDAFKENPELRAIVNNGWTRGGGVIRCQAETHDPEVFNTFAPKCIGMKGRALPDTTLSRSIVVTMKPIRAGHSEEAVNDFSYLDDDIFARLRSQLCRWAADHAEEVVSAAPEVPNGFRNRRRENWKPLLAIAGLIGGAWPEKAQKSARSIEAVHDEFEAPAGVQLLRDIRAVFRDKATDRVSSKSLVEELTKDQTGPWATYGRGEKPISERNVGRLLSPFGIKPRTIRVPEGTIKGYLSEWFADAFDRHLPSVDGGASVTASQCNDTSGLQENRTVTGNLDVTDENQHNPLKDNGCDGVTAQQDGGSRAGLGADDHAGDPDLLPDEGCEYCGQPHDETTQECSIAGVMMKLHRRCQPPMLMMFSRSDKGK